MNTLDISIPALLLSFLLLLIPVVLSLVYRVKLIGPMFYAVARMSVQLVLIGIFLKYLFVFNNALVNLAWLGVMILVAVFSAVRGSGLRPGKVLVPAFLAFSIATFGVLFYLDLVVIPIKNVFDARYVIVLGGMLLGNSLRGNIVGITTFYKHIQRDTKHFHYVLALGASRGEALLPYLRESVRLALQPTIAAMVTMGIVALPGMMTGVILGGADPTVAIKYQIMIMVAILASTIVSVVLTILMTQRVCFTRFGTLNMDIFAD